MNIKFRRYEQMIVQSVTCQMLQDTIIGVIDEILSCKWPSDTQMGSSYTVGDLQKINGFYIMPWILYDMIGAVIGRTARLCAEECNLDLHDPRLALSLFNSLALTRDVEDEAFPIILEQLIARFGDPITPDYHGSALLEQHHREFMLVTVALAKNVLDN